MSACGCAGQFQLSACQHCWLLNDLVQPSCSVLSNTGSQVNGDELNDVTQDRAMF